MKISIPLKSFDSIVPLIVVTSLIVLGGFEPDCGPDRTFRIPLARRPAFQPHRRLRLLIQNRRR